MMESIADVQENKVAECAGSIERISQVYLLLGRFFSYPDEALYETIKGTQAQEDFRILVEGLPFELNFKSIPSPSLSWDEFESEYINSFDIGLSLPCPLYESYYTGGEQTRREILEELLRFYGHFDIRLSDKERDYPDHLVAELEFMAFLANKEADAIKLGKDPGSYRFAELDFLERHLDKWVHELHETIQKMVKEPFYKGASAFMIGFLEGHLLHLQRVLRRLG